MMKAYRKIVKRARYRTPGHPRGAADSVMVTLECGHEKFYKGSQEPKLRARCEQCEKGDK